MSQWTLEPVAPWWWIIAVWVVAILLLRLRPRGPELNRRRLITLSSLRVLALTLVALMALRPGCVRMITTPQRVTIAYVADASRSMELPHEVDGETRWERLRRALNESAASLKELDQRFEIRAFVFDGELRSIDAADGVPVLPESLEGGQTDHGTALADLADRLRGDRVGAIFLFGDGVQNADRPRVDLPRALREIRQLQAPVYAVPVGRAGDETTSVDVAVTGLPDQYAVFAKNSLVIQATVRVRGFVNQEIPIVLSRVELDGTETVLATSSVTARQPDEELPVTLEYSPQEAGEYRLVLRAEIQPREVVARNNELPAFLTVYEGGLRVLYLEGELDLEQRYLRRALAASRDIEVDFLWIDHRDRSRWPVDLTTRLQDPSYDVVILGDLDSRALQAEGRGAGQDRGNLEILADRVEQGLGLIQLGGRHALGPGRYQRTALAGVMPIRMNDYEAQDFGAPLNEALHLDRELSLRPRESHFLSRLGGADSEADWRDLPPLLGANRLAGVKPSAQVILETERGEPILVVGTAGGRVATFAGDSTWRWWTLGKGETHRRFWRQMVLWAAGLDSLGRDAVVIELPQRRFSQGSPVSAGVGARTAAGDPLPNAILRAVVIDPRGERTELDVPLEGELRSISLPGEAVGEPGLYVLEVSAESDGKSIGSRRVEFIVFDDDREKSIAAADPDQLARIARATEEYSGDLIPLELLGGTLDEVGRRPIELDVEVPMRWRLGEGFWDGAGLLLVMVVSLGGEWWLRRKWGLV